MSIDPEFLLDFIVQQLRTIPPFDEPSGAAEKTIPIDVVATPDGVYRIPGNEAVGVALHAGKGRDAEYGEVSEQLPVSIDFIGTLEVTVKSVAEDEVSALARRLYKLLPSILHLRQKNLNPDTADDACAIRAWPIGWDMVPYPGYAGEVGPATLVVTFNLIPVVIDA